jgi:hypothetical protein
MRPLTPSTSYKLFATGATVGPLVDSLHNQCLLRYNVLPIAVPNLLSDDPTAYWFCSSWTVPPLLGIAYVVLGGLLPRWLERGLQSVGITDNQRSSSFLPVPLSLSQRAWTAVATTAVIIKLSELLETHPSLLGTTSSSLEAITGGTAPVQILVLLTVALFQWALLDATWSALLTASIVSIGGPLSELPFVAQGVWEYLPTAGDYLPLAELPSWLTIAPTGSSTMTTLLLGEDYQALALSSITGPCYFAVTMDAIALGRWFDGETKNEQ